jgi:hypothetical protein
MDVIRVSQRNRRMAAWRTVHRDAVLDADDDHAG